MTAERAGDPRPFPFPSPVAATEHVSALHTQARGCPGLARVTLPSGAPAWLATRHADVRQVHTHPALSREAACRVGDFDEVSPPAGSLLALDGENHRRLRGIASSALNEAYVADLVDDVGALAQAAAHRVAARGGQVDLVADFTRPFVSAVLATVLGLSPERAAEFEHLAHAALAQDSDAGERRQSRGRLVGLLVATLREPVPARPGSATEPLVGRLRRIGAEQGATTEEVIGLVAAIVLAGTQTTIAAMATILHRVLVDSALRADLSSALTTEDGAGRAVDELLRLVSISTVSGFPRVAVRPVRIAGTDIGPDEVVIASLDAANEDPFVFDDAEHPNLARSPNAHVAFGHGPHYCLGARLARVMLAQGLRAVVAPGMRLRHDPARDAWSDGGLVRGPVELWVTVAEEGSS